MEDKTACETLTAQHWGVVMEFDPALSFSDNLARFRAEAERIDPDCARILFENLALLAPDGDGAPTRQAVQEFNRAVLAALDGLPEEPAT